LSEAKPINGSSAGTGHDGFRKSSTHPTPLR
jgi:hypothetical protein